MRGPGPVKPRLIAGRFSRAERIRQRARINLEDAALTPKTLVRYYNALRKLIPYVERAAHEETWMHGSVNGSAGCGKSVNPFSLLGMD